MKYDNAASHYIERDLEEVFDPMEDTRHFSVKCIGNFFK